MTAIGIGVGLTMRRGVSLSPTRTLSGTLTVSAQSGQTVTVSGVTMDEAPGSLRILFTEGTGALTAAQAEAGQDQNGDPAPFRDFTANATTVNETVTLPQGLDGDYTMHLHALGEETTAPLTTGATQRTLLTTPITITASTPADNATDVNEGDNLSITLDRAPAAGSFVLYDASGVVETFDANTSGPTTTMNPTGLLAPGTGHYILADGVVDSFGNALTMTSATLNFTTRALTPASITDLAATGGFEEVGLSWSLPDPRGSALTAVRVYRGPEGDARSLLATLPAGATSYTDDTVDPGTAYDYDVRAVNAVGQAGVSNVETATATTVPAAPSLTLTAGDGSFDATITPNDTGGLPILTSGGYELRGDETGQTDWLVFTDDDGSLTVTGLTNDVTLDVQARVRNANGWSPWSAVQQVTPTNLGADMQLVSSMPEPGAQFIARDMEWTITLDAVPVQGSYEIWEYPLAFVPAYTVVANTSSETTTFTPTGLAFDREYFVVANNIEDATGRTLTLGSAVFRVRVRPDVPLTGNTVIGHAHGEGITLETQVDGTPRSFPVPWLREIGTTPGGDPVFEGYNRGSGNVPEAPDPAINFGLPTDTGHGRSTNNEAGKAFHRIKNIARRMMGLEENTASAYGQGAPTLPLIHVPYSGYSSQFVADDWTQYATDDVDGIGARVFSLSFGISDSHVDTWLPHLLYADAIAVSHKASQTIETPNHYVKTIGYDDAIANPSIIQAGIDFVVRSEPVEPPGLVIDEQTESTVIGCVSGQLAALMACMSLGSSRAPTVHELFASVIAPNCTKPDGFEALSYGLLDEEAAVETALRWISDELTKTGPASPDVTAEGVENGVTFTITETLIPGTDPVNIFRYRIDSGGGFTDWQLSRDGIVNIGGLPNGVDVTIEARAVNGLGESTATSVTQATGVAGSSSEPDWAALFGSRNGAVLLLNSDADLYQSLDDTGATAAAGDPVGYVLDRSGKGNHFEAPSTAARPTLRSDGTGIELDGTQWLRCINDFGPADEADGDYTVIVCAPEIDETQASGFNGLVTLESSGSNYQVDAGFGGFRGRLQTSNNGTAGDVAGHRQGTFYFEFTDVPNSFTLKIDGTQYDTGTYSTTFDAGEHRLGANRNGNNSASAGKVVALIIYNGSFNATQQSEIDTWLAELLA